MPFQFFFSYAREDSHISSHLNEFFADLERAVKQRAPGAEGFFDTTDIRTGDNWSVALRNALMRCKVLVCATSPIYPTRPYCGKEVSVFRDRQNKIGAALKHPIVLPVIWVPIKPALPPALAAYQMHDDTLPEDYRVEGLDYLMRLKTKHDQYEELIIRFAAKIVAAATENDLADLTELPDLSEVEDAFNMTRNHLTRDQDSRGPNSVRFVFVAGARRDMKKYKASADCYGDEGGWDWKPFKPKHVDPVGFFSMEVCLQERFHYNAIVFGPDLANQVRAAQKDNAVVIMIVDLWSLKIPLYKEILQQYDALGTIHSAVIIPINPSDPDTAHARDALRDLLTLTLPNKLNTVAPLLQSDLPDPSALRKSLQAALTGIKMKILEIGEARKRLEGNAIEKPTIPVPGGAN
jgi:FxsC-like protein